MNIKDLEQKLNSLSSDIERILRESGYNDYDDLSGLDGYEACKKDADQLQKMDEYRTILYKLQAVADTLEYFQKPITEVGYLQKNSNGRYSLNDRELSSGYGLEYLCTTDDCYYDYDNDANCPYWIASRIEHNGKDYYIVGCKAEDITTVKVRLRR